MNPIDQDKLTMRVVQAAQAAMDEHGYVTFVDVLTGMRLLEPSHVKAWRNGRTEILEEEIRATPSKVIESWNILRRWAEANGLSASDTNYVRYSPKGIVNLRFTLSGDAESEKAYRIRYSRPSAEPGGKQERESSAPNPVVFQILRDSSCSECGIELEKGDLLFMEAGQPLCLSCAGLADLEFLERGDAALTRRTTKYTKKIAVVVQFSRSRGRYERQGILAEPEAIAKAEAECTSDAAQRAAARARSAVSRQKEDGLLIAEMTKSILKLFPSCPPKEAQSIAMHTAARGSGRVGRTAAGRSLSEEALTLAVIAAIRHRHTDYDRLLSSGLDRMSARERTSARVQFVLDSWRS